MGEAVPALHHLDQPAADDIAGVGAVDARAVEGDRALCHLAALGPQQIGDRLEAGRLAGAVGAQQCDDAALWHRERDTFQHQDHVVVDDLDIVDREQRRPGGRTTVLREFGYSHCNKKTAFPAKAGTHPSGGGTVGRWIPAFAGNAIFDCMPGRTYRSLANFVPAASSAASLLQLRGVMFFSLA